MRSRMTFLIVCVVLVPLVAGCGPKEKRYPLTGQVIGVAPERKELTVDHKDIPGFMPAMVMPYAVRDATLLQGLTAGDYISATLVRKETEVYLADVRKTGHGAVSAAARPAKIMDVMQPGDEIPDDVLADENGRPRKLSDWRGRALGVTFIYTRCPLPDFCPLMDRNFAQVQRAAAADPTLRDRVHLLSISFDPEHDTPAVLKEHAAAAKADPAVWSFLTGKPDAIAHVAERFGVSTISEQDAVKSITHNLRTAVVDPEGRVITIYNGNQWKPDQMVGALRHALGR